MLPPKVFQLLCTIWARRRPLQLKEWLGADALLEPKQQETILRLLDEDLLLQAAPMEASYRQKLLKQLVTAVEDQGHDLCDQLCEQMCELLMQPKGDDEEAHGAQWSIKTFVFAPRAADTLLPPQPSRAARDMEQACAAHAAPASNQHEGEAAALGPSSSAHGLKNANLLGMTAHAAFPSNAPPAGPLPRAPGSISTDASSLAEIAPAVPPPTCNFSLELEQALAAHAAHVAAVLQGYGCAGGHIRQIQQQQQQQQQQQEHGQQQVLASCSASEAAATPVRRTPCGAITVRACHNMLAGSTGCAEWEAGLALSEALLNHPELVRGATCLELGCGTGLVGMHAARAGAAFVAMTDGNEEAVQNCAFNCRLNGINVTLCDVSAQEGESPICSQGPYPHGGGSSTRAVGVCNWSTDVALLSGADQQSVESSSAFQLMGGKWPDVILGADLVYDPEVVPTLVQLIKLLLSGAQAPQAPVDRGAERDRQQDLPHQHKRPAVAYIASTRRNPSTTALFEACVVRAGLCLEDLTHLLHAGSQNGPAVRWQCVASLEAARPRILIHALSIPGPDQQQ